MHESRVAALFIHGDRSSRPEDGKPTPMLALDRFEVVQGQGIREDRRYFRHSDPGRDRKRQISLIDEGTILRHQEAFGEIAWNTIKAQIVLAGDVYLPGLVGNVLELENGSAIEISVMREPCFAMDFIREGLRDAMRQGNQGAMAKVLRGGWVNVGERIRIPLT
jgi:hypothetical protein